MESVTTRSVEARAWLATAPGTLAANRFGSVAEARAFVDGLYREGATEVLVENLRSDADGVLCADSLLVRVPAIGETRWAIERFCRREGPGRLPPEGFVLHASGRAIVLRWESRLPGAELSGRHRAMTA